MKASKFEDLAALPSSLIQPYCKPTTLLQHQDPLEKKFGCTGKEEAATCVNMTINMDYWSPWTRHMTAEKESE